MPPGLSVLDGGSSDEEEMESSSSVPSAPPSGPGFVPPSLIDSGSSSMQLGGGLSIGGCSSDEDEGGDGVGPMPSLDISDAGGDAKAKDDKNAFHLSQSGAFKVSDFQIRSEGGLTSIGGADDAPTHAHPNELGMAALLVPTLEVSGLADLEMLEQLGAGASGTVSRARHRATGTIVAVKCVTILEKAKRDQVVSELRIMKTHAASWLVHMHNAFYEDARVYTVLEYMDGGSIEDLIKSHQPSGGLRDERELARIGRQLLEGLNYLHRQLHQVHRDLKPANVMLNKQGAVKISDFGISSQLENTAAFCSTFVGTTCYMSPERLSGEAYTYSADIWAYGIILMELATGSFPYPKPDSYFQLYGDIMDKDAPTLPEGAGFSTRFAELIGLCLDKEPQMRPAARDLLKHEWFRQPPAVSARHSIGSSSSPDSARHDRTYGRGDAPLERSRSSLKDDLLEMTNAISGMSLAAALKAEGLRQDH